MAPRNASFAALLSGLISLSACNSKQPVPSTPAPKAHAPHKPTTADKYVQAKLIPLDSNQDGQWDLLAVEWTIAPHWHIYWTNPGDSGIATKVRFDAASKDKFGPVRLPAPVQWMGLGDILGYGYMDHTAFFAKRLPGLAPHQEIEVKLSWLVCKHECHRGRIRKYISASAKAQPFTPRLRQAYQRLPTAANPALTQARWTPKTPGQVQLDLRANRGTLTEFYPLVSPAPIQHRLQEGKLSLSYKSPPSTPQSPTPLGVFGIRVGETTTYHELSLPWPSQ